MQEIDEIKKKIFKIAALTDRGQRQNKLIGQVYQENLNEMGALIERLKIYSSEIFEQSLSGELELIYSNLEIFQSFRFFLLSKKH